MSKFINLDDFNVKAQKQFQYKGKTYNIEPLGFGAFVEITSKRQKIAELNEEASPQEIYDLSASIIKLCVPELSDEDIQQMSVTQLMNLAKFVQEQDEETQEIEEEMGN